MNYNTIAARFPEKLSPSLDFPTPLAAERIFSPATQRDRSRDPRSVPVSSGRLDPQRMSNTLPVQSPLRPCIRQKSLARYGRLELCSSRGKFLRAQASHIPERTAQGSRKIQARNWRRKRTRKRAASRRPILPLPVLLHLVEEVEVEAPVRDRSGVAAGRVGIAGVRLDPVEVLVTPLGADPL